MLVIPFLSLSLLFLSVSAAQEKSLCQDHEPTCIDKQWKQPLRAYDNFTVAGINLASYQDEVTVAGINLASYQDEEPFELFDDFDISHLIKGNESWDEILAYRNTLQRPSLSFYVDKVARKRWLPHRGYHIPHVYALQYESETRHHGTTRQEQAQAILEQFPSEADYAAKPTHMSLLNGNWLVRHDKATNTTTFSNTGRELIDAEEFNAAIVAESLAESLHSPPEDIESWALKNVRPGFVLEERWTAHDNDNTPPHEVNIFTIWGKVWTVQWNVVEEQNRWCYGFFHRNGTLTNGSLEYGIEKPEWMDWSALVELAEELGAHKDMFRLDVFLGVPASVKSLRDGATVEERLEKLEIAVSESEIFPTTFFDNDDAFTAERGARLWIAGYKMGNYRVVPNTEVPEEFKRTGQLSADPSGWYEKE